MFMKRKSRLLYREMLLRIGSQLKPGYSEKQWIEKGFHVSYQTLSRLLAAAKDHTFADEQERIWFFKTQQPRFAAWMEYFSLLYTSQLFLPEGVGAVIDFWSGELQRTQNFLIEHASFHEEDQQDETAADEAFSSPENSYSRLAAQIIGREKYLDYVQQSLIQLLSRKN
jgi:hypothetical protein